MVRRFVFWWFTAATETNHPVETGLDNSGSATPGFNDWFESSSKSKTRMKCGSYS
jgi:hypothetical protein